MRSVVTGRMDPALAVLACVVSWALVWEAGYTVLSFECVAITALALVIALLLSWLGRWWPALRMAAIAMLCLSLVVVFLVPQPVLGAALLAGGTLAAGLLHRRVQPHFFVAFAVVFLVMKSLRDSAEAAPAALPAVREGNAQTRLIVHLVMDEMGAFESLPTPHRQAADELALVRAYESRGFRIWRDLSSTSPDTYRSLSRLLSADPTALDDSNFAWHAEHNSYAVLDNNLHRRLAKAGWAIDITQSSFLDFCSHSRFRCHTYPLARTAHVFEGAGLPYRIRLVILWRELTAYLGGTSEQAWKRATPTLPLLGLAQLEAFTARALAMRGRHYVFAHFLWPHFPWTLDRSCALKSLDTWQLPYAARQGRKPDKRTLAFAAYTDQVHCAHQRLLDTIDRLDAAFPGQVSFVIHGDHGPRILARELPLAGAASLDEATQRNLLNPFVAIRTRVPATSAPAHATLQSTIATLITREAGLVGR